MWKLCLFLNFCYHTQGVTEPLTDKEFESAFNTLKTNKSAGYDNISANSIKNVFDSIKKPLKFIFNLSLQTGDFPGQLKIAKITPIFKSSEETSLNNYRPISVL